MFWILFSAAWVTAMAGSTYRLSRGGDESLRPIAIFAAMVCLAITGVLAVAAVVLSDLTCYESCFGEGWRHDPDAWQWTALPALAIPGFAALLASAVMLVLRRYRGSLRLLAAAVVPFVPFAALVLEFG